MTSNRTGRDSRANTAPSKPTAKTAVAKTAVDASAAKYWADFYKDSGYGKLWVRTIPKRIQAALTKAASATKKTANSSIGEPNLAAIATVINDDGVILEGTARWNISTKTAGKSTSRLVLKAFVAEFDHEGNLKGFDVVDASK